MKSWLMVPEPGAHDEYRHRVLQHLPRADQRRWAEIYLMGLTHVRGRKSIRNIADFVGAGSAVQSLQQFINQSPWDWDPVRREVARILTETMPVRAWVVEKAVIPKRGDHSVGVARRFVATAGRTVNCQVGLGTYLASDWASVPVDWRILLPNKWTTYGKWRTLARIPDSVTPRSEPQLVLDMIAELTCWGLPGRPVLVNLADESDPCPLLTELDRHGVHFVAEVPSTYEVLAGEQPLTVRDAVDIKRIRDAGVTMVWESPEGVATPVASAVVRPVKPVAPGRADDGSLRLIAYPPAVGHVGERFWVTNMQHRPLAELTSLIRLKARGEDDMNQSQDHYGVRDFEGRSYQGWHHHMTLVSAAHAADLLRSGVREQLSQQH